MSSLYNSNQIQELYNRSLLYLGNSNELIKKKEFHKAGEMSWGAIVLLLKAVGLIYNYSTGGHKKLIILRKY